MRDPRDRCSVRICAPCSLEWAVLKQGGSCSVREGLWAGTAFFAALSPGVARLTIGGGGETTALLLRLPPGTNVEILWDAQGRLRWRRLDSPCFYNARPKTLLR